IFAESEDEPEQLDLGSFENVQGSVQFQKITSQGEALSDPVFSLYRDGEKVRTDIQPNSDGKVFVDDLEPGRYTFKEVSAAEGYILNTNTLDFVVTDVHAGALDTIDLGNFINYQGSVRLHKTDPDGSALAGAQFELRQGENVLSKWVTDEFGAFTVDKLAPGDYTFVEVKAPDGFAVNTEPIDFTVDAEQAGEPKLIVLNPFINYQG
ncbi:MSCRAMM family protein, partial [Alkalibacterium sp. AK22]|uniref:MSCRAMM family protein n=1 Tax=Alkalibacterium sp. AK22 TaxID=1229520 RepID=UPI0005532D1E